MAFCRNCGQQIDNEAVLCPHCGVQQTNMNHSMSVSDDGNIGWGLLGFFVPIAGLILYLIWKDERPKSAKLAGIGALASAISCIAIYIIMIIIMLLAWLSVSLPFLV